VEIEHDMGRIMRRAQKSEQTFDRTVPELPRNVKDVCSIEFEFKPPRDTVVLMVKRLRFVRCRANFLECFAPRAKISELQTHLVEQQPKSSVFDGQKRIERNLDFSAGKSGDAEEPTKRFLVISPFQREQFGGKGDKLSRVPVGDQAHLFRPETKAHSLDHFDNNALYARHGLIMLSAFDQVIDIDIINPVWHLIALFLVWGISA
jgi:hypothetical protein